MRRLVDLDGYSKTQRASQLYSLTTALFASRTWPHVDEAVVRAKETLKLYPPDSDAANRLNGLLEICAALHHWRENGGPPADADPILACQFHMICGDTRSAFDVIAPIAKELPNRLVIPAIAVRLGKHKFALDHLTETFLPWTRGLPTQGRRNALGHAKLNPELESVRDEAALAKLPEPVRNRWQAFWAEIEKGLDEVAFDYTNMTVPGLTK